MRAEDRKATRRRAGRDASTLACAVLALGITGCATVREARRAQEPARVPAGERTATASELGLEATTVLGLEQATALALAHHPAMVQARQSVRSAELALDNARGGRRPNLSASAGATRGTGNRAGESFSWDADASYSAGLSFDLLLFDFGKTDASVRQAAEALFAAEEERRSTELDTVLGVRAAFFELARAEALLAVAIENEAQVARQLEQAKTFAEFGRRQPYDITRAEVELGNARLGTISASNTVVTSRAALTRSLGLSEDPGFRIAEAGLAPPPRDLAALLARAREGNPEWAALEARARAASAAVDGAIANLYPDLKLGADAGLAGGTFPLAANVSGAARLAAPLFDGRARRNRIEDAVAQLRSARARVAAKEQQVRQELASAVAQLVAAEERLAVAETTAAAARENAALAEERYKAGVASAIEQADAQGAVTSSLAEQIRARCDRWLAFANVERLTGLPSAKGIEEGPKVEP